jgi:hypothetical protein
MTVLTLNIPTGFLAFRNGEDAFVNVLGLEGSRRGVSWRWFLGPLSESGDGQEEEEEEERGLHERETEEEEDERKSARRQIPDVK